MIVAMWTGVAISDNRRLMHTRGRMIPNPAYIAFKNGMALSIKATALHDSCRYPYTLHGRISLTLHAHLPSRMDTMAIIKAACDAVQLSGAILDDNQIDCITVIRTGRVKGKMSSIEFRIEETAPRQAGT